MPLHKRSDRFSLKASFGRSLAEQEQVGKVNVAVGVQIVLAGRAVGAAELGHEPGEIAAVHVPVAGGQGVSVGQHRRHACRVVRVGAGDLLAQVAVGVVVAVDVVIAG